MPAFEVYDHLYPATRAGVGEKEPLLVRSAAGDAPRGSLDGAEDVFEILPELAMTLQDVCPRSLSQNDRATVRIDDLAHATIVPGRFGVVDSLFEPGPILSVGAEDRFSARAA